MEPTLKLIDTDYRGHPRFAVFLGDEKIGEVFGHNPTFDRKPRGSRIVTKRWTSRKRYWCAQDPERRWNPYSLPYDTRKRAVESLVRATLPERI